MIVLFQPLPTPQSWWTNFLASLPLTKSVDAWETVIQESLVPYGVKLYSTDSVPFINGLEFDNEGCYLDFVLRWS